MKKGNDIKLVGGIGSKQSNGGTQYYSNNRIYDSEGIAPALNTIETFSPNYTIPNDIRIRKLTPSECFALMGFTKENFESVKAWNDTSLYHCAGDSIIVCCLIALFGEFTDIDYRKVIKDYIEKENQNND